jgi:pimeloyl-ACP methyl ester carboxylesterase
MITAYGGDRWCRDMILRWAGRNSKGLEYLKSDDSLNIYPGFFKEQSVIQASNKDYEAGATVDVAEQEEDQKAERKIKVPLLLVYSEGYIGKRYDVPQEWADWVDEGVKIDSKALGDGIGHFGAEEAPEETAEAIKVWIKARKLSD